MQTSVAYILEFMTSLYHKLGYSALNTAKSALSSFVNLTDGGALGTHPLICRFMRGVFNQKPPAPRYRTTWDVKLVLDLFRKQATVSSLNLRELTLKTCMLIALVSAQRQQTLHLLNLDTMQMTSSSVIFQINDLLKQSRPGRTGFNLNVRKYPPDPKVCAYTALVEYLDRTKALRLEEPYLFISYRKPHQRVTTDTIARWIKSVMKSAGIDVGKFKPHSTRAAASSKAKQSMVPITDILKHVGWSSETTFCSFYNKPLQDDACKFTQALLQG